MKVLKQVISGHRSRMVLATIILTPSLAFSISFVLYRSHVRDLEESSRRAAAAYQVNLAEREYLLVKLIADPEVALREHWYSRGADKQLQRFLLLESLKEKRVAYTADQLAKIYLKMPEARAMIVSHPACDSEFLMKHWNGALVGAGTGDDKPLTAMVSNLRTPLHLVEKLDSLESPARGDDLQAAIDLRLHATELVMSRGSVIQFIGSLGDMRIWAGNPIRRSYTWNDVNKDTILKAHKDSADESESVFFRGFTNWKDYPHDGTDSGEFREGQKNFATLEEASGWLRRKSEKLPTVYRNDGLVVCCGKDTQLRKITVEVWQIVINGSRPVTLPGGVDSNISVSSTLESER
jgi:hypothetical protein